jgi:hypothetical protein
MKGTMLEFVPESVHSSIAFADEGKTYRIEVRKTDRNDEGMIEVTECVLGLQSDGGDFVELSHFDDILSAELYANQHHAGTT